MAMASSSPMDRLQALDNIEKDIATVLQTAGQALTELGKDKPANKQVESHVNQFRQTLSHVETELAKQINYLTQVSTGQAHEGSSYMSQKTLQMAMHRLDHAKRRLGELESTRSKHMQVWQQSQIQKQPPPMQ
ncbi:Mediator of RNA polymerase II transcription subunit 11 [Halocaridina rubra]|uniref:Mediator of RNA polymerase II transcription subunit 11 n=1 Tax=Halocaridina rubra TaxID=373956 RepID=A0AAN9ADY7_HALRR